MLDFVPHYAAQTSDFNYFWQKENKKYKKREGKDINFSTGFWSPPLTAQEVFNHRKTQINKPDLKPWFRFPTTTALTRI
jgi:hypothetical protein